MVCLRNDIWANESVLTLLRSETSDGVARCRLLFSQQGTEGRFPWRIFSAVGSSELYRGRYIYIYISLVKRYTVIILSRYAVLQLVLLRSSEKYFYRYPRNMSIARIFHFALIVVTVRGKYQNILLLLRVYNLRVCFCSTNKIQLVLFQNIDHFKKLSSQEEPVYRESRAKTRLKTVACC